MTDSPATACSEKPGSKTPTQGILRVKKHNCNAVTQSIPLRGVCLQAPLFRFGFLKHRGPRANSVLAFIYYSHIDK